TFSPCWTSSKRCARAGRPRSTSTRRSTSPSAAPWPGGRCCKGAGGSNFPTCGTRRCARPGKTTTTPPLRTPRRRTASPTTPSARRPSFRPPRSWRRSAGARSRSRTTARSTGTSEESERERVMEKRERERERKVPLRSAAWFQGRDELGAQHRAVLRAMGIAADYYKDRPIIGIANSWSELNNCNAGLREVAAAVKRGVLAAGGLPLEFPTISLGEELTKPSA